MDTFPLENFLNKGKGVYSLCLLAIKRAKQLNRGQSIPQVEVPFNKVTTIALEEIIQGKLVTKNNTE